MSFQKSDIGFFLSGGTSNTDINLSIGNGISNTAIVSAQTNNLLPDTTPTQASSGITKYRCFYVKNLHGSETLDNAKIWIMSNTLSAFDEIDIGIGSAAINGTEPAINDETTAPAGVTFTHPTSEIVGLSLGDLAAGDYKSVWIRQTVDSNSDPIDLNACILKVRGTPV